MSTPVLICDDSSMARKQIARALPEGWGVELSFAGDGAEALDALRQGKGDILFLDLTMPVLDGYQTLEAIAEEGLSTKVIVVSGDIQPDARRRVLELGALEFIKKPVDGEQLAAVLERFHLIGRKAAAARGAPEIAVDIWDCYREVANVAMGQAADLLARMLDVFVILPVPNVNYLEASELRMALTATEDYDSISAVCQGYIGAGIAGEALLLFNDASFKDMARLMKFEGRLDSCAERELLMDVSNILIGACLKGVADQLDIRFSQGHPTVLGQHSKISDLLQANAGRWARTLAIEINYAIEDYNINCDLLLLFTDESIPVLNDKLTHLL
ncbi:response regulator [Alkalilimnicola sp. S0819]|uniref:response regulator n=1 Tax=Alkalilimnicola sp. S0819 TaxID=2613922 RepID=UPI0012627E47|nr:response regulator [Alkalilimnicola sp. S0819]KAB7622789.1 response regulator [Alkalilimnicola sp. S0819]MPQ17285.1 response regulator [Alkalilimnicola sp. S0819]